MMRNIKGRASALVAIAAAAFTIGAAASSAAELPTEPKCEFIASPGSSECMLPFPDDYYTKADPTSPTGRRIDFRELATPTNAASQHIEVAPYNTGDGFSPGSVIALKVPGIETTADVTAMNTVPINHLGRYKNANAPVVVIDTSTGQRWPIWVEIDSTVKAGKGQPRDPPVGQLHLRRPLHRRTAQSQEREKATPAGAGRLPLLPRQPALVRRKGQRTAPALRRNLLQAPSSGHPALEPVPRVGLHGRERRKQHRPRALDAQRGVLGARRQQPRRRRRRRHVADVRRDESRKRTEPGRNRAAREGHRRRAVLPVPELRARRDDAAEPRRQADRRTASGRPTSTASSRSSATTGAGESARPSLYGHGLFGSAGEVASGPQRSLSQAHDIVQCATDEIGMSESDLPSVVQALQNLSAFPKITDRLQQGLLDELYLGPGDDQPERLHDQRGLPPGRHAGDAVGAEHQPPLLQRQQPGRHHGRRADGGLAGLHARLARRAGDELLGAAAALGRTSTSSRRSSTPATPTKKRGR